jgi:hypothetical protein
MAGGRASKWGQGLCLLGALILWGTAEAATVHRDMRDMSFTPVVTRAATVDKRIIHYTLRYQKPTQASDAYSAVFAVWALYDPMKYDRSISSIMLTDHGAWANEILLAHETSHYWYDRLCLGLAVGGGTEAFAQGFQTHYQRYMARRR